MTTPADGRSLDELFVRYWDNALTDAEAADLEQRLTADPVAREAFRLLCLQAVAAADLPVAAANANDATPPSPPRRWTRRRALRYLAGAAACTAAGVFAWRQVRRPAAGVRLSAHRGAVAVRDESGAIVPLAELVPAGATLSTSGPGSSAVLSYPDGTDILITGDSVVTVGEGGLRLLLQQGSAIADVAARSVEMGALTLVTPEAILSRLSRVILTLGRGQEGTEVGVHKGLVSVTGPSGEPLEELRGGEVLTVRAGGDRKKQQLQPTPDEFVLDLTRPLPAGWHLGKHEVSRQGPVLRPELWFDPYHQTEMWQVRSDHRWSQGFCRLFPETIIRVRYWVDVPGPSQLCVCVRTDRVAEPATGVVETNTAFTQARPREWQWLEVKVADMLDNVHTPKFAAPWVAFLLIFNTYKVDIGLKVAQLRITRGAAR